MIIKLNEAEILLFLDNQMLMTRSCCSELFFALMSVTVHFILLINETLRRKTAMEKSEMFDFQSWTLNVKRVISKSTQNIKRWNHFLFFHTHTKNTQLE